MLLNIFIQDVFYTQKSQPLNQHCPTELSAWSSMVAVSRMWLSSYDYSE